MRIAHLSDLHFGHHDEVLAGGLAADVTGQSPDLVVVSGDFTQVGSSAEFARARAFLNTLTVPFFAVPGNHDVPGRNLVRRFLNPYKLYRRYIAADTEPFLLTDGVALAGIRTTRRVRPELNWSNGIISREQLWELEQRFKAAPDDAVRIVVAHHPLMRPEGNALASKRHVDRADRALKVFAQLGVRLVLSGHFHLSYVRRHENVGAIAQGAPTGVREAAAAPILVCQASSTISTRLRGEPNAYNLVDIDDRVINIRVREWRGDNGWVTRDRVSATA